MLLGGCRVWLGRSLQCGFIKHRPLSHLSTAGKGKGHLQERGQEQKWAVIKQNILLW